MYSKEGSDIYNIARHIEALKRQLKFEVKLQSKTQRNDLGKHGVAHITEQRNGRPITGMTTITAVSDDTVSETPQKDEDDDDDDEDDVRDPNNLVTFCVVFRLK